MPGNNDPSSSSSTDDDRKNAYDSRLVLCKCTVCIRYNRNGQLVRQWIKRDHEKKQKLRENGVVAKSKVHNVPFQAKLFKNRRKAPEVFPSTAIAMQMASSAHEGNQEGGLEMDGSADGIAGGMPAEVSESHSFNELHERSSHTTPISHNGTISMQNLAFQGPANPSIPPMPMDVDKDLNSSTQSVEDSAIPLDEQLDGFMPIDDGMYFPPSSDDPDSSLTNRSPSPDEASADPSTPESSSPNLRSTSDASHGGLADNSEQERTNEGERSSRTAVTNGDPPANDDLHPEPTAPPNDIDVIKFRFEIPDAPPPPEVLLEQVEEHWFWRIVMLLVSWLHLVYHLPHRGCNLALKVLAFIFISMGRFEAGAEPPTTLNCVFRRLGLTDAFVVCPACPKCKRVYAHDSAPGLRCEHCDIPLFKLNARARPGLSEDDGNDAGGNIPRFRLPFYAVSSQLPDLLSAKGMVKNCENWRSEESAPGILRNISDGERWKTLPGPDGRPFFDNGPDRQSRDELRLGVTIGFDGFGYQRSRNAGTHSSGVLSCTVANLPVHMKYRPRNLLVTAITPGPKEFSSEELQHVLKLFVDDMIRLYEEGVVVVTPEYPDGIRVRVVIVAVCCDHPALCRVCGFADHASLTNPCPRCKCEQEELKKVEGLTSGFEARNGEDHRRYARENRGLEDEDQDTHFFVYGARYFELSRLRYFDAVRMSVLDPMHNILLGIIKTQWLDAWVKAGILRQRTSTLKVPRELDQIQEYLAQFEMPSWVGRLPHDVGYPSGGSLTADEYKALGLVYLPIIIPLLWNEWQPVAQQDYEKKLKTWNTNEEKRTRRVTKGKPKQDGSDKNPAPLPEIRMHADDADNFLKLAAALKIILARSISLNELDRAEALLKSYLEGYYRLHGDHIKPNFHWVTHIFDQIRDYGPVYGFWTFTYERLNKVLKSYSTNNHDNGEVEVTFFRAFSRDMRIRNMITALAHSENAEANRLRRAASAMLETDSDNRGTVAAVAREVDELAQTVSQRLAFGASKTRFLSLEQQDSLIWFYRKENPQVRVYAHTDSRADNVASPNFIFDRADFLSYVALDGRRIYSTSTTCKAPNSIVQIEHFSERYVGQVVDIFEHHQRGFDEPVVLFEVRWFKRLSGEEIDAWKNYPELEVDAWEFNIFLDRAKDGGPPSLVKASSIISQACRATVVLRTPRTLEEDEDDLDVDEGRKIWLTIGLAKDVIVV